MHLQPVFEGHHFIAVDNNDVGSDIFCRGLCLPSDVKMSGELYQKEWTKNIF
jgi:hypothetical protein